MVNKWFVTQFIHYRIVKKRWARNTLSSMPIRTLVDLLGLTHLCVRLWFYYEYSLMFLSQPLSHNIYIKAQVYILWKILILHCSQKNPTQCHDLPTINSQLHCCFSKFNMPHIDLSPNWSYTIGSYNLNLVLSW